MSATNEFHKPVLIEEVIGLFFDAPIEFFIDATLGDGGHSHQILTRIPDSEIIGIDRDPKGLKNASERLVEFNDRMIYIRGKFGDIAKIVSDCGSPGIGGVLFDLGLRSEQIDDPVRGFSYIRDGALDMRMDPDLEKSAYDIVNEASRGELARIIAVYGEQPGAGRIARAIEIERRKKPIETTVELAEIVRKSLSGATAADLSRVFQAIRIVVNDELEEISRGLESALDVLIPGGILAVISYHSLEDRIVKRFFVSQEKACICPPDLPVCRCGNKPRIERITKKPITPSDGETVDNPRARSAKLRAARKL
jgi:16S rRNA (cytosine1402-N4)-methyltransferase